MILLLAFWLSHHYRPTLSASLFQSFAGFGNEKEEKHQSRHTFRPPPVEQGIEQNPYQD
ncbi:hypothetical protein KSC_020440 [Ktedonobacter sp. SOSP1-52]|nr:hypothetical protein KSC_020440 [Ktedonobacter sp. SOSP1-52]